MRQIGAFEAKNTFGSLLDLVEAGEEILITRHGKPTARLAPLSKLSDADRARAHAALERIRQRARENPTGPFNWEEWKSYRDEGRR